ncbi:PREDICTED: mucin-6, partial [Condylura cristata]|uniref:mucin-6 n=1 Tax=Condylura cristata TaxID=143302 RepID=UPI0006429867
MPGGTGPRAQRAGGHSREVPEVQAPALTPSRWRPVPAAPGRGWCSTWGPGHFSTFDGHAYDFSGTCNYVFAAVCKDASSAFSVQLRRGPDGAISRVIVELGASVVTVQDGVVSVKDVGAVALPYTSNGLQITPFGQSVRLVAKQLALELELMWGPGAHLMVRTSGLGGAAGVRALGRCPANQVYRECGEPCARTCSNPQHSCSGFCTFGCFCPEGTVLDDISGNGSCVAVSRCPCLRGGVAYAPGEVTSAACRTCRCAAGRWDCTERPCPGRCSLEGGSFVTTFDARPYRFHGTCSYVLLQSPLLPDGGSLTAVFSKSGYSHSETSLSAVIYTSGQDKIAISQDDVVTNNGEAKWLPYLTRNVTVFRQTSTHLQMATTFGLELLVQLRPVFQAYVTVGPRFRGQTRVPTRCEPGCVCAEGLYEDASGQCVPPEDCPCEFAGTSYPRGAQLHADCKICTCAQGSWTCHERAPCSSTCALYGEGHVVTFDGQRFVFEGSCEYVLATDGCGPDDARPSFKILTENVVCGKSGVTCSRAIRVLLGGVSVVLADRNYTVSGEDPLVRLSVKAGSLHLVLDATVGHRYNLSIVWNKHMTVLIKVARASQDALCGLCGNANGNMKDDFETRSRYVAASELEFVNSWKESPLCGDARLALDPCSLNAFRRAWAERKCGIINSQTFAACHGQDGTTGTVPRDGHTRRAWALGGDTRATRTQGDDTQHVHTVTHSTPGTSDVTVSQNTPHTALTRTTTQHPNTVWPSYPDWGQATSTPEPTTQKITGQTTTMSTSASGPPGSVSTAPRTTGPPSGTTFRTSSTPPAQSAPRTSLPTRVPPFSTSAVTP